MYGRIDQESRGFTGSGSLLLQNVGTQAKKAPPADPCARVAPRPDVLRHLRTARTGESPRRLGPRQRRARWPGWADTSMGALQPRLGPREPDSIAAALAIARICEKEVLDQKSPPPQRSRSRSITRCSRSGWPALCGGFRVSLMTNTNTPRRAADTGGEADSANSCRDVEDPTDKAEGDHPSHVSHVCLHCRTRRTGQLAVSYT